METTFSLSAHIPADDALDRTPAEDADDREEGLKFFKGVIFAMLTGIPLWAVIGTVALSLF